MTGDEALKKILPHLEKKLSKALGLILKLVKEATGSVTSEYLLFTLSLIHEHFHKLVDIGDIKMLVEIYNKIRAKERDLFDESSQKVFDLLCFSDFDKALIIQLDDSFEVELS